MRDHLVICVIQFVMMLSCMLSNMWFHRISICVKVIYATPGLNSVSHMTRKRVSYGCVRVSLCGRGRTCVDTLLYETICVAVCCSVLQCVAVCCSVTHCVGAHVWIRYCMRQFGIATLWLNIAHDAHTFGVADDHMTMPHTFGVANNHLTRR